MSQMVLYFLHSTSELSFHIDVVLILCCDLKLDLLCNKPILILSTKDTDNWWSSLLFGPLLMNKLFSNQQIHPEIDLSPQKP